MKSTPSVDGMPMKEESVIEKILRIYNKAPAGSRLAMSNGEITDAIIELDLRLKKLEESQPNIKWPEGEEK